MTATSNAPCQPNARNCFTSAAPVRSASLGLSAVAVAVASVSSRDAAAKLTSCSKLPEWCTAGWPPVYPKPAPAVVSHRVSTDVPASDPCFAVTGSANQSIGIDSDILALPCGLFVRFRTSYTLPSKPPQCTRRYLHAAQKWQLIEYHADRQIHRRAAFPSHPVRGPSSSRPWRCRLRAEYNYKIGFHFLHVDSVWTIS